VNYPITPVPKPRMTQRDKRGDKRPSVARYHAFKDEVALRKVEVPISGAKIMFILPMPRTWSKKRKDAMDAMPHQQKPDLDNLLKALLDAVYSDDSRVWHIADLSKSWGYKGSILIE